MAGGGPYVGYGAGGWTGGLEAGGGFAILQGNVGIDLDAHTYLRGDVVGYLDELTTNAPLVGGRIGGGVWLDDEQRGRGMFVFGVGGSATLGAKPCVSATVRVHDLAYSGVLEIQLRYAGSWLVVFAPRIDASANFCERT